MLLAKKFTGSLLGIALLGLLSAPVAAQQIDEQIALQQGDIFEMLAYTNNATDKFRWVLTQDQNFIKAARDDVFQMRFTSQGTYSLVGESDDGSVRRRFSLVIGPRLETTPSPELTTIPAANPNGTIALGTVSHVLEVFPGSSPTVPLALDLDTTNDGDNDGNPSNENDAAGTFFSMNGSPLRIWFVDGESKDIALREGQDSYTFSVQIGDTTTTSSQSSSSNGSTETSNSSSTSSGAVEGNIAVLTEENGRTRFGLDQEPLQATLAVWRFGDGTTSFLDRPVHSYQKNGTYTVSVSLFDLQTTEEIGSFTTEVTIDSVVQPTTPTPDPNEEEPDPSGETNGGGSLLGFLFKAFLVILLSGVIGGAIMWLISKMRGSKLSEKIEKAEQVIVGSDAKKDAIDVVTPLEIPDTEEVGEPEPESAPEPIVETPPVEEEPEEPVREPTPPPEQIEEELQADTEQAPDWLKTGLDQAEQIGETPATPHADTIAPAQTSVPEPTPEPAPAPAPQAPPTPDPAPEPTPPVEPVPAQEAPQQPAEAPMPDWLQPQAQTPEPTPTPEPAPQPSPEPQKPVMQEAERIEPADNEPVAFIRAEGAEEAENTNTEEEKKEPPTASNS